MSVLYLIDAHSPVLGSSRIRDTIPLEPWDAQTINGSFAVRVPFGVPVDGVPLTLSDLLTSKFSGLLAYYPGYTDISYDEGIDGSGWDALTSRAVQIGARGTTSIGPSSGVTTSVLQSVPVSLGFTAPSVAVVTWEVFVLDTINPKNGGLVRNYIEADSSNLEASVSFDGGVYWHSVTDGVQVTIPAPSMGTDFCIRLENPSTSNRFWVGSWAVIY